VVEYSEPRRSWIINSDVCSNGLIYISVPIDVTFLALYHIRKHCNQKAMSLDSINDEKHTSTNKLLTKYVKHENLVCISDKKQAGDITFFKYNHAKTIAWLGLKTRRISETLKNAGIE